MSLRKMNKYLKIDKILFVLCAFILLLVSTRAFAYESKYTNMLVGLSCNKDDNNNLNFNLNTIKPYYTKIEAVKKSNFEYVIILPETYNALETRSSFPTVHDSLQDVKVELFPYLFSDNNNGYTKITIVTAKLDQGININNKVVFPDAKLAEKFDKITSGELKTTSSTSSGAVKLAEHKSDYFPKTEAKTPEQEKLDPKKVLISQKIVQETSKTDNNIVKENPKTSKLSQKHHKKRTYKSSKYTVNRHAYQKVVKRIIPPVTEVKQVDNVKQDTNAISGEQEKKIPVENTESSKSLNVLSMIQPLSTNIFKGDFDVFKILKMISKPLEIILIFIVIYIIFKGIINLLAGKKHYNTPVSISAINENIDTDINTSITNNAYEVIDGFELLGNKGLYLIKINGVINLIGTNGDEFIVLKQFKRGDATLALNERDENHLVAKCGNWKGLIFTGGSFLRLIKEVNIS